MTGILYTKSKKLSIDSVFHQPTPLDSNADGVMAEEIVQQYPSLNLADVYQVVAYYLRRPSEVETYLQQRKAQAEVIRKQNEARFDPQRIRDRLLARRASRKQ
ncbi:hypothetical protein ES703_83090 [subsurface metagenome]